MKLTPEQRSGLKFEIWIEELLKELGKRRVRRNIAYCLKGEGHRQVDLEYRDACFWNPLVIVEAKYKRKGLVKYSLRGETKKNGQQISIDSLLDEVEERRQFVGARKVVLVTNRKFEKKLRKSAESYSRVQLYDCDDLNRLDREKEGIFRFVLPQEPIEQQIRAIDLRKYNLGSKRVYLN